MIRRILTLTALLFTVPLHAQPAGDTAKLAEFKAFATGFRKERAVLSLSYAIVKDGKIVAPVNVLVIDATR